MINPELQARGVEVAKELVSLGVPAKFAAAMAGNAMLESGARPIAPSKDGSDGLWQWRDAPGVSRLTALKRFSVHYGVDWREVPIQCKFAIYECENDFSGLWAYRNSDRGVATLALDWCDEFERPAEAGRVPQIRIAYAQSVYSVLAQSRIPPIILAPSSTEIPGGVAPSGPVEKGALSMPAILLSDVLPLLAPILGKVLAELIKELEANNPGMAPALKQIFGDIAAAL